MGWMVGLPLGLFRLLGGFLLLVLRFAVPVLILVAAVIVIRRLRAGAARHQDRAQEPKFRGPVYTVDYEEVEDPEDQEEQK